MNFRQTFPPIRDWKYSFLMMGFFLCGIISAVVLLSVYQTQYLLILPIIFLIIGGFYSCYLQGKSYLKFGKDAISSTLSQSGKLEDNK